jgi:hypothetical protein
MHDHADHEMSFLSILLFFMTNYLKFVKWGLKKALTITKIVHLFVVFKEMGFKESSQFKESSAYFYQNPRGCIQPTRLC